MSSERMDGALMALFDIFERASCPFILLGETARSIVKDGKLKGEKLEVGVTYKHATKEVFSALNTVVEQMALDLDDGWEDQESGWGTRKFEEKRDKVKTIEFRANHIPVVIKVIRKKSKYFSNPDSIVYNFDDYKVPNPFNSYWKVRGII